MVTALFSLRPLDLKLGRDLWRMRGQALAIALVAMCGIATFVMMRGSYEALALSQARYYEQYRFADVFAGLKRAPLSLLERIRELPGVNEADGRVVFDASLDVPGLEEPASGRIISLSGHSKSGLNRLYLRAGTWIEPGSRNTVLVSEAFSQANNLRAGDFLHAIINGRRERLQIAGIAISPEYVNEIKGNSFPDNRRFGVLWMERDSLDGALNMRDGFNDLSVVLAPHASEHGVIAQLDRLLAPYGTLGAYGRKEQLSHNFLESELTQNRVSGTFIPAIFLAVVAFLIHNVLQRITSLQRAQIGLLKSFGYGKLTIALHYLKFSLITVTAGAVAGIGVGVWFGHGLASLYSDFYHFPKLEFALSGFAIATALLIATLSASVGAALAIFRVLNLSPAEAMRPESPASFKPGPLERLGLQRYMPLPLRIIMRNLERRPWRAMLSILGLAFGVALMITGQYTFDALEEIIRVQFRQAQREDMTVTFNETRDRSVAYNLASLPGVVRVEPFRSAAVRLRFKHHQKKTAIMGLDPARELRRILDEKARPIQLPADGIVLTKKLAQILGANTGDRITVEFLEGRRNLVSVPVHRIVDEPVGTFAYMANQALARISGDSETVSGAFLGTDSSLHTTLYRQLKTVPAISSVNLREATLNSFLATVGENMKINTLVLVAFACIITMGIVYNSARIALSEHAVELASLRILGFTKGEIGFLLLGEQALLVLPAIPLGCLLGYGLAALLSFLLSQELFRIPLIVSERTFILSIGVLLLAASASGYLIWRKVRKLDLIEVLKTRE